MFVLKIRREVWESHDGALPTLFDETVVFIPADKVTVNSLVPPERQAKLIEDYSTFDDVDDYASYTFAKDGSGSSNESARLIHVYADKAEHWYLASQAWLMDGHGNTIERIAP